MSDRHISYGVLLAVVLALGVGIFIGKGCGIDTLERHTSRVDSTVTYDTTHVPVDVYDTLKHTGTAQVQGTRVDTANPCSAFSFDSRVLFSDSTGYIDLHGLADPARATLTFGYHTLQYYHRQILIDRIIQYSRIYYYDTLWYRHTVPLKEIPPVLTLSAAAGVNLFNPSEYRVGARERLRLSDFGISSEQNFYLRTAERTPLSFQVFLDGEYYF